MNYNNFPIILCFAAVVFFWNNKSYWPNILAEYKLLRFYTKNRNMLVCLSLFFYLVFSSVRFSSAHCKNEININVKLLYHAICIYASAMLHPAAYCEVQGRIRFINVGTKMYLCCFFVPVSFFERLVNPDESASPTLALQVHLQPSLLAEHQWMWWRASPKSRAYETLELYKAWAGIYHVWSKWIALAELA